MKPRNTSSKVKSGVYLGSAIYLLGQVLSTFILGPVILVLKPFSIETRFAVAQLWVTFNLWLLKRACGLTFELHGLENIPVQSGLVLSKHQSAFETIALQAVFSPAVFILKQELLRIPVWGWAMASLEPIAIDRSAKSRALKQVLREGAERIAAGRWVVLFPEGTRVAPGQRGHYGSSGGVLAQRAGCPVVPVAHNAGEFWGKNGFLKLPGVVQIHIGPALDGSRLSAAEINQKTEEWIETQMQLIG